MCGGRPGFFPVRPPPLRISNGIALRGGLTFSTLTQVEPENFSLFESVMVTKSCSKSILTQTGVVYDQGLSRDFQTCSCSILLCNVSLTAFTPGIIFSKAAVIVVIPPCILLPNYSVFTRSSTICILGISIIILDESWFSLATSLQQATDIQFLSTNLNISE